MPACQNEPGEIKVIEAPQGSSSASIEAIGDCWQEQELRAKNIKNANKSHVGRKGTVLLGSGPQAGHFPQVNTLAGLQADSVGSST